MLLSLVLHMYSMCCVLPAAVLLGTAPTYVLAWGAWRLLSAFLPSRFYQAVDDRLYCIYQSMVLFFFENYTGVQVRPRPPSGPARRTCRPSLRLGSRGVAGASPSCHPPSVRPASVGSLRPGGQIRPREHVPLRRPPTVGAVSRSRLGFGQVLPCGYSRITR